VHATEINPDICRPHCIWFVVMFSIFKMYIEDRNKTTTSLHFLI